MDSQASYRRQSQFVPFTPAFDAPIRGVPVGLLSYGRMAFDMETLEWFGHTRC